MGIRMARRIIYITACIVCIFLYGITGARSLYIVSIISIILPILSAVYTYIAKNGIKIQFLEKTNTYIRGGVTNLSAIAENMYITPVANLNIVVVYQFNNLRETTSKTQEITIAGMNECLFDINCQLSHSGCLTIDMTGSYIYDPMKLFKFRLSNIKEHILYIMPILVNPDYYGMYTSYDTIIDAKEYSKTRKGEDVSEIFDVHSYVHGDSLNRVHWKLSAKEDALMVKELSLPVNHNHCIIVDVVNANNDIERSYIDGVYELAYALGNIACLKEKYFQLAFYKMQHNDLIFLEILNIDELSEAMRLLIKEKSSESNLTVASLLASSSYFFDKIYYITNVESDLLYELDNMGYETEIYIVGNDKEAGNIRSLNNIMIFYIDCNDISYGLSVTSI